MIITKHDKVIDKVIFAVLSALLISALSALFFSKAEAANITTEHSEPAGGLHSNAGSFDSRNKHTNISNNQGDAVPPIAFIQEGIPTPSEQVI